MANFLKMALTSAIKGLLELGWSHRRIARELGVHRETVGRYAQQENPASVAGFGVTAGSESKPATVTPGSDAESAPKPATVTAGSQSLCQPYFDIISGKLEQGLSAQRIFQDISSENGFSGSYPSVKRFVKRLGEQTPLPFRRMECEPGAEAQVDFGTGTWIIDSDGKKRNHVFRICLSFSRKSYSEGVFRQDTETFIRCLENAFRSWGGVPKTLVLDNLKAAVTQADWYDPELNPKIVEFARHYGIIILPTKPYMPRHKGKIENGVKYVKNNALKGRTFTSLGGENEHLQNWERQVADTRIHGTTRKQVGKLFEEVEKSTLQPLPAEPFPFYHEGKRTVHRDGHIEVGRAYYSVPPEYLGREIWVRWDSRLLRVFNQKFEQIAVHGLALPGKFSTDAKHISDRKISSVERGAEYLVNKAFLIGSDAGSWAKEVINVRGIQGIRTLQGFISLASKHSSDVINKAGKQALTLGCYHLRPVRELCNRMESEETVEFQESHAVIRPMAEYQQLLFNERSIDEPPTDTFPQTAEAVGPDCHAGRPAAGGGEFQLNPPGISRTAG